MDFRVVKVFNINLVWRYWF